MTTTENVKKSMKLRADTNKTNAGRIEVFSQKRIPHAVYSNVIEDIQQQQYVFEILWNKATPAEQRIREIEDGIERVETIALKDITEIAKELIYNDFLESYKKILDRYKKGEHKGIRFITTIDKDNQGLATLLLNEGVQIGHTKNLTPLSFSISNKEFLATAEKMEGGMMIRSLLVSTEPTYIDHYNFMFEQLWDNSIDARDRINDIKEGVDLADIEVIPRSAITRLPTRNVYRNDPRRTRLQKAFTGSKTKTKAPDIPEK
jgi:hypothetical protein